MTTAIDNENHDNSSKNPNASMFNLIEDRYRVANQVRVILSFILKYHNKIKIETPRNNLY